MPGDWKEAILQKLRKNSGYFDAQGNAPKIIFEKFKRCNRFK